MTAIASPTEWLAVIASRQLRDDTTIEGVVGEQGAGGDARSEPDDQRRARLATMNEER